MENTYKMSKNLSKMTSYKGYYKVFLGFLIVMIGLISMVSAERYEYYNTNDDSVTGTGLGAIWKSQTFTVGTVGTNEDFLITNISVKIYRVGSPGTCLFSIRAVNGTGYPTGTDLTTANYSCNSLTTSSPGVWINVTVNESIILDTSTSYALIIRTSAGDGSNYILWRVDDTSSTYTGGTRYSTPDSGVNWNEENPGASNDAMFEIFGTPYTRSVTLNSPTDYYNSTISLVNHNCSSDAGLGGTVTNMSLFSNISGSFVRTNSTTGFTNQIESVEYGLTYPVGTYDWYCEACFNDGTCSFSTINNTINIKRLTENSVTYNSSVSESSYQSFILNLSYVSSDWNSILAYLVYNGTSYSSTRTGTGDTLIFNKSNLLMPLITPPYETKNFYWNISLINGTGTYYETLNTYNQVVNSLQQINISSTSCPAGFSPSFFFLFGDETNLTNQSADVNYNIKYGLLGNTSAFTAYGSYTGISNFTICINNSNEYFTTSYGQIDYSISGDTDRKYYVFSNTRLTNETVNNTLYGLSTTLATSFLVTVQDNQLENQVGAYLSLMRWYPSLNAYKVVDMGVTDDKGQTVLRVKTEDVDYRIGVYKSDGTLIKLTNPIRMVCLVSPCEYTVYIDSELNDYVSYLSVQSDLVYNETTKIVTFTWNDPTQKTSAMNLVVTQVSGTLTNTLCNVSATGFTGILTCDLTGQTGAMKASVYRSASPITFIKSIIIDEVTGLSDISGGKIAALLISLIFVVLLSLIGIYSPIAAVVLGIVGLIPAAMLGGLPGIVVIGFGVLGGIVFHFLKRT